MCHVKRFTSNNQKLGQKGERIAEMFLMKRGFNILERNFTKKYGEIDLIATKAGVLHFVEVKTLRFTGNPAENVTRKKFQRLVQTSLAFLKEKGVSRGTPWQIDVISIVFNEGEHSLRIDFLENIHI